ncbi:MAG: ABC transporter permease [Cytophagales bacterium]|nr:ABC transporter permease [Cytophagales bacterium]
MDKEKPHMPEATPPQWAVRFLEWYCASELLDEIQGDLYEAFYIRAEKHGLQKARHLFIKEVFLFCKPSSFKKSISTKNLSNMPGLLQNYLKTSFRNTLKDKVFAMINIVGLAIGMAACFLIMQYVLFELSYDRFHENGDRIYRVILKTSQVTNASNHPGVGPALEADFPEVEEYARAVHQSIFMGDVAAWSHVDAKGNEMVFNEEHVYNVDPSFLSLFSFPFVFGDPGNALSDVSSVVISQTISKKFFGSENPLGKTLLLNGHRSFTITGVFEDVPENSHIKFDILVSFFLRNGWGDGWNPEWDWKWPEYYTYVRLVPQADPQKLEAKFPEFVSKYMGDIMEEFNIENHIHLQALTDIHLKSPNLKKEREAHGSERTVYFLMLIAVLILVIAWINYINMSTSKSIERAREVGFRKVVGASRQQLISQFLFESALVNLLAITLSFILIVVALPYFNQLTGKNIGIGILDLILLKEPWFWFMLTGTFVFGSFLAGLYPAFVLSSFRVASVLKGKFFRSRSGIALRKTLVGSQFVISVALIAGTVMVFKQVSFMRNQELGYVKDQLLVVKSPSVGDSTFRERLMTFKTELKRKPDIYSMAPSSEIPGKMISQLNGIRNIDEGVDANAAVFHFYIDQDFIETYGIDLVAGRNFREDESLYPRDERIIPVPIIVNEKVIESLRYKNAEEAIGQLVHFGLGPRDWKAEIVGVVKNHHQRSLKEDYDPILFFPVSGLSGQYFTINLRMQNAPAIISFIEKAYKEAFPGNQFEYFFLDDYFDSQYASDQQFGKVFGLFSSLALIVACLGLLGLSTFMISRRIKEIAVRKVLGATVSGMVYLFSRDFVKLIVIANVIALPLVYLAVQRWLNNFAFQVKIGWVMFIIPVIILLIIALTTVSIQTIKTGSMSPVNSLRQD